MEDEPEPTQAESTPTKTNEDVCPSCREGVHGEKSSWIRCDACKIWFHWACVGDGSDLELINKWCILVVIQLCISNTGSVGLEWLENDETAMREPIVVENPEGLRMKMPPPEFSVQDVADEVGPETPVEVIEQSNSPGWTLGRWAEYYNTEPSKRDKIRNVIHLIQER
ncbi:hypothetical protein P692DRAFT_201867625 [Suillus brevipes Sb2]|nr:hypothetical protein P692DRAFT_201867625 [Suillus brevipes Sb2]